MKTYHWSHLGITVAALLIALAGVGKADVLFQASYDRTDGTDAENLAADYALGGTAVQSLVQVSGKPEITEAAAKFGAGGCRYTTASGDSHMAYKALGNLDMNKGSFECWVKFQYTSVSNRILDAFNNGGMGLELFVSSSRDKLIFMADSGDGDKSIASTAGSIVDGLTTWHYISCDWDFSHDSTSENGIRLWTDGVFQNELTDFAKNEVVIGESDLMGIFSQTEADGKWVKGYGDEVRITNTLISDLYTLDGNKDYTAPTEAFAEVPEPATLMLLAAGGMGILLRRKK